MNQASDTILKTRTMYIIKVTEQNIPYYKDINDSLNKKVTLLNKKVTLFQINFFLLIMLL